MSRIETLRDRVMGVRLTLNELQGRRLLGQVDREKSWQNKAVFVDQLQGVDPKLVDQEYGTVRDIQAAKRFGARSLKEFSFWSWRSCAMANVASVLASEGKLGERTLFQLVQEALLGNGYAYRNKWGKEDIGWRHRVLVDILRNGGLQAEQRSALSPSLIAAETLRSRYVIASVKSERGGHMVLVKGGTIKNGLIDSFAFNNPYVFGGHGGENLTIDIADWNNYSLEREIITWLPK